MNSHQNHRSDCRGTTPRQGASRAGPPPASVRGQIALTDRGRWSPPAARTAAPPGLAPPAFELLVIPTAVRGSVAPANRGRWSPRSAGVPTSHGQGLRPLTPGPTTGEPFRLKPGLSLDSSDPAVTGEHGTAPPEFESGPAGGSPPTREGSVPITLDPTGGSPPTRGWSASITLDPTGGSPPTRGWSARAGSGGPRPNAYHHPPGLVVTTDAPTISRRLNPARPREGPADQDPAHRTLTSPRGSHPRGEPGKGTIRQTNPGTRTSRERRNNSQINLAQPFKENNHVHYRT